MIPAPGEWPEVCVAGVRAPQTLGDRLMLALTLIGSCGRGQSAPSKRLVRV